jgi:UDP-2,3-diacylglucosamine pyrophosphatase LpxH
MKRQLDIVILSDLHLGTYSCHARELLQYLSSIETKMLILNGDILDAWQFKKRYFPKKHMQVIQLIIQMALSGTKVYYITGNHDDVLRRFTDLSLGKISLRDKLVLQLKGEKYWIFHGDIFDQQKLVSPMLYFFGKRGYDIMLRMNRWANIFRRNRNQPRRSLSKKIKNSIRKAQFYINSFEQQAVELAAKQSYDYVICGHIHHPVIKKTEKEGQTVTYMNAGDWVESLSALEYRHEQWSLYTYDDLDYQLNNPKLSIPKPEVELPKDLLSEILERGEDDEVR